MRLFLLLCSGLVAAACGLSFNPDLPSNSDSDVGSGSGDGDGDGDGGPTIGAPIDEGAGAMGGGANGTCAMGGVGGTSPCGESD